MRNFNLFPGYSGSWAYRSGGIRVQEQMYTSTKAAKFLGISLKEFGELWRKLEYEPDRTGKNKEGQIYYLWSKKKLNVFKHYLENSKS